MRLRLMLLLALVAIGPLQAQSTKSWLLTLEERIALRTNADLARARVQNARLIRASGAPAPADIFDGSTHPELFLPHEVFEKLIKSAFGDPREGQIFRNRFTATVKSLGLRDDFWKSLEQMSAAYIGNMALLSDVQKNPPATNARELVALEQEHVCSSRAKALADARGAFGQERFDQFLYEAIAVRQFHVADRLPDPATLRNLERGCRARDVRP